MKTKSYNVYEKKKKKRKGLEKRIDNNRKNFLDFHVEKIVSRVLGDSLLHQ